jgi:hypothetical protein
METRSVFDAPLTNPYDDLLGMDRYARTLARFIHRTQAPFTLGIYGEWGSGKTSYANLASYYLKELTAEKKTGPVLFIPFTSWDYKTSDDLWRALILKIARCLYAEGSSTAGEADMVECREEEGKKEESRPAEPAEKDGKSEKGKDGGRGALPWLGRFLAGDALVLRRPPVQFDPLDTYEGLKAKLEGTPYGNISKDTGEQVRIDQEEAILAIVNATLTALGGISPLVAGLRSLFGLNRPVDLERVLYQEKNEAAHKRIESIQDFKAVLRDLLEKKARGKRVIVFVDDLDRLMPDVALDILEAIKIFLGYQNSPLFFIVAVDQSLVGQGLRLRFKELLENNTQQEAQAFYSQKGQEYFEKVIQVGFPVPARTVSEVNHFLGVIFPKWATTGDLLHAAIGDNPRRLKQYCTWLTYKFNVAQLQDLDPLLDDGDGQGPYPMVEKMISLYWQNPDCWKTLAGLAGEPQVFQDGMGELEACLGEKVDEKAASGRLPGPEWLAIYRSTLASTPLASLFLAEPLFSKIPPQVMAAVRFADIQPERQAEFLAPDQPERDASLTTRDPLFSRILQDVSQVEGLQAQSLLLEDLTRLVELNSRSTAALEKLAGLAGRPDWAGQMGSVEAALELIARGVTPPPLADPFANDLVALARDLLNPAPGSVQVSGSPAGTGVEGGEGQEAGEPVEPETGASQDLEPAGAAPSVVQLAPAPVILTPPRSVLLDEPRFSAVLPEVVLAYWESRTSTPAPGESLDENFQKVATTHEISSQSAAEVLSLGLLPPQRMRSIEAALNLRIQLARHFLVQRQFAKLEGLSRRWPELSELLLFDPWTLQELEREILWPEPVQGPGLQAAPRISPEEAAREAEQRLRSWYRFTKDEDLRRYLRLRPYLKDIPQDFMDHYLLVSRSVAAPPVHETPTPTAEPAPAETARASSQEPSRQAGEQVPPKGGAAEAALPPERLLVIIDKDGGAGYRVRLESSLGSAEGQAGLDWREIVSRWESQPRPDRSYLQSLGGFLYEQTFREGARDFFKHHLRVETKRILLELRALELERIPWEALFEPEGQVFPALSRWTSFLRVVPRQSLSISPAPIPPRVLGVFTSPPDLPPLDIQREKITVEKALVSGQSPVVSRLLDVTMPPSYEHTANEIATFHPGIVHFSGYSRFDPQTGSGNLLFVDGIKRVEVKGADYAGLLSRSAVHLAVLRLVEAGKEPGSPSAASLARDLIRSGIPAVLVLKRPAEASDFRTWEKGILEFSKRLYQGLLRGQPVESVVFEARRSVDQKGLDWSAFSLYSGASSLDGLRFELRPM